MSTQHKTGAAVLTKTLSFPQPSGQDTEIKEGTRIIVDTLPCGNGKTVAVFYHAGRCFSIKPGEFKLLK